MRREAFPHTHYTVLHVERKSLQSEKPMTNSTQYLQLRRQRHGLGQGPTVGSNEAESHIFGIVFYSYRLCIQGHDNTDETIYIC